MKKVVVVVDKDHKEIFNGKCLKVDNLPQSVSPMGYSGPEILTIKDGNKILADFRDWMYWREVE